MSDGTLIELIDALSKPDAAWHRLSELEKRQRLDGLTYGQRKRFGDYFSPMPGFVAQLVSLADSLERQDSAALQAQYDEITRPTVRGG